MLAAHPLATLLLTLVHVPALSGSKVPTRNLSILDRMPQGMGKRGQLQPRHPLLLLPPLPDPVSTHLHQDYAQNADNTPPGQDSTHPGDSTPCFAKDLDLLDTHPQENIHKLENLLRQGSLHRADTLQHLVRNGPRGSSSRRSSSSSSSSSRSSSSSSGSTIEEIANSRLMLLYALPTPSSKRGRRGWKPRRGRRGRGYALGGKRQAVLDRMPLSYGKKRDTWASADLLRVGPEEDEAHPGDGALYSMGR